MGPLKSCLAFLVVFLPFYSNEAFPQDFWQPVGELFSGSAVDAVTVDSAGTILTGGSRGIFLSHDNGLTWSQSNFSGTTIIDDFTINSGAIFAGTLGDGVFRSVDAGTTWV